MEMEEFGETNPLGSWSTLQPSFKRQVKALLKKQFVIKFRHYASIIEFAISVLIYIVLYPVYVLARTTYDEVRIPELKNFSTVTIPIGPTTFNLNMPTKLFAFYSMAEKPCVVACPNTQRVRELIGNTTFLTKMVNGFSINMPGRAGEATEMKFQKIEVQYVDNQEQMANIIYETDNNGIGIDWVNQGDADALTSPKFELSLQMMGPNPENDLFFDLKDSVARMKGVTAGLPASPVLINSQWVKPASIMPEMPMQYIEFQSQIFARKKTVELFDISMAVALFAVLPIILSSMPDLQTVLEEKDSKVASLGFLMGCSETAYWFVSFITPFILSFIPYFFMCIMLCFGFGMLGTSFTLCLVISILFLISHLWFQLFISTFMKKGSAGRAMTVIFLVFIIFFSYLHSFFTLDENNTSDAIKHVLSIIPFSAFQLVFMQMYMQCMNDLPAVKWSDFNSSKLIYPPWIGFMWLVIDCLLYFALFMLFNATNGRNFGTPLIKWSEFFSKEAWKRLFSQSTSLKVAPKSDEFLAVEKLSKVYKGAKNVQALDNIEFSVQTGEVIVMIGPNGAGKSTLINILSGAVEPTDGVLRLLGGMETTRFKEVQSYLGVCFQENVIINLLSVREHFILFGAFRGVPEDTLNDAIDFFAHQLQLTHMLDNRAGDLSGGQKRKLCIALSLLGNPPLVLMDEPTAGVDVQARQLIWKMISNLKETTSIITSHALEEAEAVSSRLFIVAGGKVPFCGTSTELRNKFKCGYILRIEREDGTVGGVLQLAQSFVPDAHLVDDKEDSISMPVDPAISQFLNALVERKDEFGVISFSFSVEQLEDVLMKLIQSEEVAVQQH